MNEKLFSELPAWLTQAGLAGAPETDIVSGFCDRCVTAGIPLGRAHVFIDTLHPVHEGSLFRWGYGPKESSVHEYGRTSLGGLDASSPVSLDLQATDIWQRSPFHHLLRSGAPLLRRRVDAATKDEFSLLPDWLEAGMTDYVAIITRFAAENVLGEMDGVYSSWGTGAPDGFSDAHIATLERIAPYLALAIKSVSLTRMTKTLMETYLGRDAGQRVLSGRIMRGNADRIDAVVWFSDLRGFTHITDTARTGHPVAERLLRCNRLSDP
jgi:adenylate cyclase